MAGEGTNVGRINVTLGLKNEMSSELAKATASLKTFESGATNVGKNVENSLGNSLKNVSAQSSTLGSTISNNLGKAFSGLSSKISSSLSSARSAISSFASAGVSAFNGLVAAGDKAYKTMGFFGTAMAAIFTVKLKSAIQEATSVFMQFDDQMRKVQAVTESTGAQFDELTAQAKLLGATTSFTAQEAAEAMTLLGQAGFDANEVIAAMPATLNLARASMTELATTADIMSNIMNGFRLSAEETERASDVLSKAANATNTNVTELGQAMKYVAPLAYQMGWSLEETAAAAGLLSNAGIKSSMSGTVLRNAISRLLSPTDKATQILQSYGITLDGISPKTHNFAQIIDILAQSGISAADIMTVFGMRAGPGILAMLNIGTGAINNMNKALYDSAGYAQAAADKMDAGWGGTVRRLNDMVEALQISFGKAFAEILTPFLRAVSVIGVAISKLPSPVLSLAAAFALAAVAAGTLLVSLAALPVISGVLSAGLEVLTSGVVGAAFQIAKLSSAGGLIGSVFSGIASAIALVTPHVTLVIAAIVALGVALYELEKKTQLFSKSWETLKDLWTIGSYYLGKAFGELKTVVVKAIDGIIDSLKELAEDTWLGDFIDMISRAYSKVSEVLGQWRADTHETAEAIRAEEAKEAESAQNVQKSIENAHQGIVSSYQTVDEATGETYASMIENASDAESSIVGSNDSLISSNNDLANSYGGVETALGGIKTALSNLSQTDISEINPGSASDLTFEALAKGIELVDGSMLILDQDGQLVIKTLDGVITKLSELHSASLTTASGEQITVLGGGEGTYSSTGSKPPKKISLEESKNREISTADRWAAETGQPVITLNPDGTVPNPNTRRSYNYTVEEANDTVLSNEGRPKTTVSLEEARLRGEQFDEGTRQKGTGKTPLSEAYLKKLKDKSIMERVNEKYSSFMGGAKNGLTDNIGWSGFFKSLFSGNIDSALGGSSPKTDVLGSLKNIWNTPGIGKPLKGLEGVSSAGFDFSGIFKNIDTLKEKVSGLDSLSLDGLNTTFGNVKQNIGDSVSNIPIVKSTLETLNGISYEGLKTSVQGYVDSFTNSISNIPIVKSTLETLNGISYDGLKTSVQGYVDSFANSIMNIPIVKSTMETLNDVSYDSLKTTIQGYVDSFTTSVSNIPIVKSTMETLNTVSYESLKTSIQGYVTKFSDSILGIPLVKSTISTIDTIKFPNLLTAIGDVSSALDGLKSTAKTVYDKVVEYVNDAKEYINNHSSSGSSGTSGVTRSGGSGTGEGNVKINTVNNYNSSKSTSGLF